MSFRYNSMYDSSCLRGKDDPATPRPWDLTNVVSANSGRSKKILDIGCGTAFKLIPLSPHFHEMTGLDINSDMIVSAKNLLKKNNIANINLVNSDSTHLPFKDNTFDVITCMLSRWQIEEIVRVLKPDGTLIVEHIGCEDKKDFKIIFGKDDQGWRGQFIQYQKEDYLHSFYQMFSRFFNYVKIENGYWRTYYTEQGILEMLKFTPTIRDFDIYSDYAFFKKACDLFKSAQGIALTQNRVLVYAKNI